MVSLLFSIIATLLIGNSWIFSSASSSPASENFYYSNNITDATLKFTSACNYANGTVEVINHPSLGAQSERLQVVVCALGNASARSIVYTISGTHGIEGYAGSMAQISMLLGPPSMFPQGVRMVHVHLINPYGVSYILKENEDNADQLKNEAGYYSLNYDSPIVQELMDGIDWPNLGNATVRQNAFGVFAQLVGRYGESTVNAALKTGQGKRPRGIAYFGSFKSWSSNTTDYVITKYLRDVDNILLLDWHSAVGPYGQWSFIPIDQKSESAFKRWAPQAPVLPYDLGMPAGGALPYSRLKTMTKPNKSFAVYGKLVPTITPEDPFCQVIIGQTREFFYPQAADWKNLTYNRINDYLPKVLAGFAAEGNHATVPMLSMLYMVMGMIIHLLS